MSKKAMIFAAGLGTRLKPLTDTMPKALVKINGKTLLQYAIEKLASYGFCDIIINIHHFANDIRNYVAANDWGNVKITFSDESDELRNTGGGLKYASWFFDEAPFLIYNVDIISTINLEELYQVHLESNALATLAVLNRDTTRKLLFNNENKLSGRVNYSKDEFYSVKNRYGNLSARAFSGIHIVSPRIFEIMNETGNFSIIDAYLHLADENDIMAFDHTGDKWLDVGKIYELSTAEQMIKEIYPNI